jgi:hypothetical protein
MKAKRALKERENEKGFGEALIRRNRQFFNNCTRLRRQYAYDASPERGAVAPVDWSAKVKVHVARSPRDADGKRKILQALFQGMSGC